MSVLDHLRALWRILTKGNPETNMAIARARVHARRKTRRADELERTISGVIESVKRSEP